MNLRRNDPVSLYLLTKILHPYALSRRFGKFRSRSRTNRHHQTKIIKLCNDHINKGGTGINLVGPDFHRMLFAEQDQLPVFRYSHFGSGFINTRITITILKSVANKTCKKNLMNLFFNLLYNQRFGYENNIGRTESCSSPVCC